MFSRSRASKRWRWRLRTRSLNEGEAKKIKHQKLLLLAGSDYVKPARFWTIRELANSSETKGFSAARLPQARSNPKPFASWLCWQTLPQSRRAVGGLPARAQLPSVMPLGPCCIRRSGLSFLRFGFSLSHRAAPPRGAGKCHRWQVRWPSPRGGLRIKRLSGCVSAPVFWRISMRFPHLEFFHFHHPPTGLVGGKWNSIGFSTWNSSGNYIFQVSILFFELYCR
jgi:hypothetical protein